MKIAISLVLMFALAEAASALPIAGLKRGDDLSPWTPEAMVATIPRGAVVVLGENHGVALHRNQHLTVLEALRRAGHSVSVGLEFFPAAFQGAVDAWRAGVLPEAEFLARIGWGQPSFDYYRSQALFPRESDGGRTLALNAARELTARVAKVGLEGLTALEQAQLPPGFQLGRESYRRRFAAQMPHLPDPAAVDRYFAAQSVWDDTMAWTATEFSKAHPEQTVVIVVGEFHVQYGGGLPDRLRARGANGVFTLSQVNTQGFSDDEAMEEVRPGADGPRADAVWAEDASVSR